MTKIPHTAETTWKSLLNKVEAHQDLTTEESQWALSSIFDEETDPVVIGAFLVGLHTKGETAEELSAFSDAMLAHARPYKGPTDAVDIVGTGGDQHNTVNISTMASLVIAGTGQTVVKHGNRASSSTTGSADALERLGLPLDVDAQRVEDAVREVGIGFLFATTYHPSMRFIAPIRKRLGVPTIFNFLGPLSNPARVSSSVIGVSRTRMAPMMAEVFSRRDAHALVFTGALGLDELSLIGPSRVWEAVDGEIQESLLEVKDIDLPGTTLADITGRDAEYNADVIKRVIGGEGGPIRDTVLLNAAAGLVAADDSLTGCLAERLNEKLPVVAEAVDSGAVADLMERWINYLSIH